MTAFNDFPLDVLERILHYILQPDSDIEYCDHRFFKPWYYTTPGPEAFLRSRLYSTFLDKQLYQLALPSYFRTTQFSIVVGHKDGEFRRILPSGPVLADYRIVFGTFEEHPLFFANAHRVRVELDRGARDSDLAIQKVYGVLVRCRRLVQVSVSVVRLDDEWARKLYVKVEKAVMHLQLHGAKQKITVKAETHEEYERPCAMRSSEIAMYQFAEEGRDL